MKFSEIVQELVDLAKNANAARARRVPTANLPMVSGPAGSVQATSGVQPGAAVIQGPWGPPVQIAPLREEMELLSFLEAQSPETLDMLTTLMYLGRGDFAVGALLDNYQIMQATFRQGNRKWAARRLADKFLLPEYLENGWKKALGAHIDLDAFVPATP